QVTTELYMPVILFIAPSLSSVNLVTTLSLILVTFSTIVVHKLENQVPAPLNNSLNRVNALSFIAPKYSVTRFQIESAVSFRISPNLFPYSFGYVLYCWPQYTPYTFDNRCKPVE